MHKLASTQHTTTLFRERNKQQQPTFTMKSAIIATAVLAGSAQAFSPVPTTRSATQLKFGIPTFGGGKNEDDKPVSDNLKEPEKKIGMSGLVQLITAGMGAAFLGDFEGVDKETGKMMFSLEANNLVDEEGNVKQTSMPYFESGWVDEEDAKKEEEKKKNGGGFKFW